MREPRQNTRFVPTNHELHEALGLAPYLNTDKAYGVWMTLKLIGIMVVVGSVWHWLVGN